MKDKITSAAKLSKILHRLRAKGKCVVFTNGCFDILHAGHVKYLKKARSLGDILVVGLNSDASVRALKGPSRPVNRLSDRALVLAALSFVDYVVPFNEPTPERLIKVLQPDVIAKGGDWKAKDIVGGGFVVSRGGRIAVIPFVAGHSTTSMIKRLRRA